MIEHASHLLRAFVWGDSAKQLVDLLHRLSAELKHFLKNAHKQEEENLHHFEAALVSLDEEKSKLVEAQVCV